MYLGSYKGRNDIGIPLSYETVRAYEKIYYSLQVHDTTKTREENIATNLKNKMDFLEANKITSLEVTRGSDSYSWKSLEKEHIYWRKANAIHKWFVRNVQSGNDDCGTYLVSKEILKELVDICQTIVSKCKLVEGIVQRGSSSKPNEYALKNNIQPVYGMYPIFEVGKVLDNQELLLELLPTTSGFFFGATDYDEWYYDQVKRTADKGQELLDTFNFEDNYLVYSSSW